MNYRKRYFEGLYVDLPDGTEIEIELPFEPMEHKLDIVGDHIIVTLVTQDEWASDPLKDWDGKGTLYTASRDHVVITDDPAAVAMHLGLGDRDRVVQKTAVDLVRGYLSIASESERATAVAFSMEFPDLDLACELAAMHWYQHCDDCYWSPNSGPFEGDTEDWLDGLHDLLLDATRNLAERAWDRAYAEGKVGTYLAIPVDYCHFAHGPGTTSIRSHLDPEDCNAVWVPGQREIDNMDFTGCVTYLDKLRVAEKYAESCLKTYQAWCNGEVYNFRSYIYDFEGNLVEDDLDPLNIYGWDEYLEAFETARRSSIQCLIAETRRLRESQGRLLGR